MVKRWNFGIADYIRSFSIVFWRLFLSANIATFALRQPFHMNTPIKRYSMFGNATEFCGNSCTAQVLPIRPFFILFTIDIWIMKWRHPAMQLSLVITPENNLHKFICCNVLPLPFELLLLLSVGVLPRFRVGKNMLSNEMMFYGCRNLSRENFACTMVFISMLFPLHSQYTNTCTFQFRWYL